MIVLEVYMVAEVGLLRNDGSAFDRFGRSTTSTPAYCVHVSTTSMDISCLHRSLTFLYVIRET